MNEYIVVIFTENHVGVLNRITACYLRRKINIESLRVSESSVKGISMFVISAFTSPEIIEKLVKQISNIIDVIEVEYYTPDELITQEIALYKISPKIVGQTERIDLINRTWGARVIAINPNFVILEKTGSYEEIWEMRMKLLEMGMLQEFSSSGKVVLHKDSLEGHLLGRTRDLLVGRE